MTLDDLKSKMAALGFGWQNQTSLGYIGFFYKQIETKRPCLCNEHNQLIISVFDNHTIPNWYAENRYSLTAEVTGETKLGWMKCEIYNLTPEKYLTTHAEIEAALIRAWEAPANPT